MQNAKFKIRVFLFLFAFLIFNFSLAIAHADNSNTPVPAAFFGLVDVDFGDTQGFSLPFPFGQFRIWNFTANWPYIETANNVFDWSPLDEYLTVLKSQGVDNVFYTLDRTPLWATINPIDSNCAFANEGPKFYGECDLWSDINPDGSGANATWRVWVASIAAHVNDPTYLQTHAHIKYWEPWNEFIQSPTLNPKYAKSFDTHVMYNGTFAQLVRMTEDARCLLTGQGKITATGETCTQVLQSVGRSKAIDPSAQITTPSSLPFWGGLTVLQNFLYCNANPPAGSQCITGDAGAKAVDIINYHIYEWTEPVEENLSNTLQQIQGTLQSAELKKPFWNGEGSMGNITKPVNQFQDPDLQAAFVPRYLLSLWSLGIPRSFWYVFGGTTYGPLWDSTTGLTKAGVAWEQVYSWMVGATMNVSCSTAAFSNYGSTTTWSCGLARAGGYQALTIWDTSESCSNGVCPTHPLVVGPNYTQYRDLVGNVFQIKNHSVPVGIKPILVEDLGNPVPVLTSIDPNSAVAGSPGISLTANGSSFINNSVVRWNGSALTTTFVTSHTLTAMVPAADLTTVGIASVTVFNPAPGGGVSKIQAFTILSNTVTSSHAPAAPTLNLPGSLPINAQTSNQPVPAAFFGLADVGYNDTQELTNFSFPFGGFRFWNFDTRWLYIQTSTTTWVWGTLDNYLSFLKSEGVDDTFYTMSPTPQWASINKTDTNCDFSTNGPQFYGTCHLWADINPDGTGSNVTWRTFISSIAVHVQNLDPNKYAHIKYWEPWNEFYRSTTLQPDYDKGNKKSHSYEGTYAQILRMTEDMRCIITGKGAVTATKESCKDVLNSVGLQAPTDSTAQIVAPAGASNQGGLGVEQNFLYCSNPPPGVVCNTGDAGAKAVDVMNYHIYEWTQPVEVNLSSWTQQIRGTWRQAESAKPFWNGEGSFGDPSKSSNQFQDPDLQAGFIPRFFLTHWSLGITQIFWYVWGPEGNFGPLWTKASGTLTKAGVAWKQVYNWMVGATLTAPCSANGTIWSCTLTRPGGYQALVIWDTSQTCNNGVCTTSPYTPSPPYTQYRDLVGNVTAINGTIALGIKAILLETSTGTLPGGLSLNLPAYLPINSQISATYTGSVQASYFSWNFTPVSQIPSGSGSGSLGIMSGAPSASWTSPGPQTNLGSETLGLGPYLVTVQVYDSNNNASPPVQAYVTLVPADLSGVRVFPNPWRSDKHTGLSITFDNLTVNTTIKIFTVSGHWVKTLPTSSSSVTWDLTNDSGEKVASGLYVYLLTTDSGLKKTGQLAVIK
jgi:hypothetical protein